MRLHKGFYPNILSFAYLLTSHVHRACKAHYRENQWPWDRVYYSRIRKK